MSIDTMQLESDSEWQKILESMNDISDEQVADIPFYIYTDQHQEEKDIIMVSNDSKPKSHDPFLVVKQLESTTELGKLYCMTDEEIKNVKTAVERIHELYELFGKVPSQSKQGFFCNSSIARQLRHKTLASNWDLYTNTHSLLRIVSHNGEGSWASVLKWKFAAFFSYHRNQEIPPKPKLKSVDGLSQKARLHYKRAKKCWLRADILLGGTCVTFIRDLANHSYDNFMEFADTVQQLKKGMPSVPISMIETSIEKTVCKLTTEPSVLEDTFVLFDHSDLDHQVTDWDVDHIERVPISRDLIETELRRTVDELFFDSRLDIGDFIKPFFPSTSANFNSSQKEGGAVGYLYQQFGLGKSESTLDLGIIASKYQCKVPKHFFDLGEKELRDYEKEKCILGYEPTEDGLSIIVDPQRLKEQWANLYWDIYNKALTEEPFVSPVGLSEPLKVRVISKGPPLLYTALKPLQKFLWKTLKRHQVFSLIGRYVLPDDIQWCLGDLEDGEVAVSGDYQASTDNLHSWVSETLLDQLLICLGENATDEDLVLSPKDFFQSLRTLCLKALTKHTFSHNGLKPQKEGQLMGSIISFPFLCLANAALCRRSMEVSDRKVYNLYGSRCVPLLVNGDDCLFKGRDGRIRQIWEAMASHAGLSSSVGKTYFSRDFCTINSTIFEWSVTQWVERKYINLGLLHGQKRSVVSGSSSMNQPEAQLGVLARELKRSCPPRLWPSVKNRFISLNSIALKTYQVPWFVPEWLGGLGLPCDHYDEISLLDRKACTLIKRKLHDQGFEMIPQSQAAFWQMHQLVMKRVGQFGIKPVLFREMVIDDINHNLQDSYMESYKLLTLDLLFTTPLERLIEHKSKPGRKALFNNAKVRSKIHKLLSNAETYALTEPMGDLEMVVEDKKIFVPMCVGTVPEFGTPQFSVGK